MTETIVTILVIIGVVLVTALVFGGWLVVATVRLVARVLAGGGGGTRTTALPPAGPHRVRCPHPRCRADNPERARFCRRCGKMLRLPQHAPVPRAIRPAHFGGQVS